MAIAIAPKPSPILDDSRPTVPLSAIQAELARRSLSWFVRLSWSVLEPTDVLMWNWHIEAICMHVQALLEGRIPQRNLLINVPPGSMKSRIVSVCTTPWMWLHAPAWRAIYGSGNPDVAIRDSMFARDLIESQWYQEAFRPSWRLADDQNAKGHYRNTARGERRALSTGSKVTGNRANALFVDDAIDAKEAHSKSHRDGAINWYRQGFSNRLSNPATGTRCVIEQRLHAGDLSGYLLEHQPERWEHLCIRQEYELPKEGTPKRVTSIGWTDPRTKENELMDAARFGPEFIAQEKATLGSAGYAGQHQQRPTSAEGNIVKREWFRYFKLTDANGIAIPRDQLIAMLGITRLVQGWDTALTEKQSSDYSAGATLGVAPARFYLLDLYKKRSEFPEVKKAIVTNHAKWGANAVPVEAKSSASGKAAVQEIRRDTRVPVIEVAAIDKVVGLNKVAPTIEAGCIYLPEDAEWVEDFIESICTFPLAVHDDDVDAFRIALDYAINGGGGMGMFEWMRQQAESAKAAAARAAQPSSNGNGHHPVDEHVAAPSANGDGAVRTPAIQRC